MDVNIWKQIQENAQTKTDEELTSQISSLTKFKDEDVKKMLPTIGDKQKLAELMKIVDDASLSNEEKTNAIKNINGFVDIASKIIPYVL